MLILMIGMVNAKDLWMNKSHSACSDTSVVRDNNTQATPYCDFDAITYSNRIMGGDTLYVAEGNYNHEYSRMLNAINISSNVIITGYGEVNVSNYISAYAVEDNGLWQNISGVFGIPHLWNTTLTLASYNYPIVQFANHTEFIAFECYNQTTATGSGTSCSAGVWLTKYPTFYGCWLANTTSKQMRCIFPGGENPNNLSLFISEEYYLLGIKHNNGSGNITLANMNFQFTRRAIYLQNDSGIIIENNTFDEGMYGVMISGSHQRGGTTIRNNSFYGNHNDDNFYGQFIKEANEESDCIITNNDVVQPIYVYNNNFYGVNGGIALIADSPTETCGSRVYNNFLDTRTGGGYASMIEIEVYCCNTSYYNNTVIGHRTAGISFGGANASAGKCHFYNNVVKGRDSQSYNETSTWLQYAVKVYYSGGTNVVNWNITHNTFIGKQAAWMGLDEAIHELYNTTVTNNIFLSNYTSSVVQKTGEDGLGNFWDYNLYYNLLGGNLLKWYMNDTLTTGYLTIADAQASTSWDGEWDLNSLESNPEFIGYDDYDFQPNASSPVCGAASDGTDIGAIPCAADSTPPGNITGLGSPSLGESWIMLNWTNPSDADFNHTEVFRNETSIANLSVAYLNSTGLSTLTNYVYRLVPVDNTGNRGNNESITNSTKDLTSPTVNLLNSSFNTTDNTPIISFNYTDALSSTANCTLYLSVTNYSNNVSVINNTLTILTSSSVPDGTHPTYINCTDSSGNIGKSSEITLIIDSTAPAININLSLNNSIMMSTTINTFNFNYTDDYSNTSSCKLYLNNTQGGTNNTVINNTQTNIILNTTFTTGWYNAWINCTDWLDNTGKSTVITINYTCIESWTCTSWTDKTYGGSTCLSGELTRTCTDAYSCGTTSDKPDEQMWCNPSGGGGGGGTPTYQEDDDYTDNQSTETEEQTPKTIINKLIEEKTLIRIGLGVLALLFIISIIVLLFKKKRK